MPSLLVTLKVEDKIEIAELCTKYNLAVDNSDIEGWLETWADDGMLEGNFVNARGKSELKNMLVNLLDSNTVTGKRHVLANIVCEGEGDIATATSYLIIFEAMNSPAVIASAVYNDNLKKIDNRWKFARRKLIVDPSLQSKG